jgi:D-inositol-3-phosphate glycosyltransferase
VREDDVTSSGKPKDCSGRDHEGRYHVAVLTGGGDRPYALGLATALTDAGVRMDFVAGDFLRSEELESRALVRFLNLRGSSDPNVPRLDKAKRIIRYYWRLIRYAAAAEPRVFHILWNNTFELFDRSLLTLYYRLCGKRLLLTVHNVNIRKRDGQDSLLNRLSLRLQYRLVSHLFVHTEQMARELESEFSVPRSKISVIPFGVNSTVPETGLSASVARERLSVPAGDPVVLFFGNIAAYKGLEYLVAAVALAEKRLPRLRLIIAGRPKGSESYWAGIEAQIRDCGIAEHVIRRIEYIADEDIEVYFRAADVLVLPYTHIFQSGVLFLGYNFGLPVIATDVGSLREDILDGETGFVCRPRDPEDLARAIERFFDSDLFHHLDTRRLQIREFAHTKYSWERVAELTVSAYDSVLGSPGREIGRASAGEAG